MPTSAASTPRAATAPRAPQAPTPQPSLAAGAPPGVPDGALAVPFSLQQWQIYVAKESELLIERGLVTREQRYLEMVDNVAGSLLEFGLEPEIVEAYRRDVSVPLTEEHFRETEQTVAAMNFAAVCEPESVPLRRRQLVREMVGAIRAGYLGVGDEG